MKTTITWLIIILIILIGGYLLLTPSTPTEEGPIKIGFIGALTGLGASQGEQELKGVQLAVEEINSDGGIEGRKVELIIGDASLDKLNVAGSVAHKLIDIDKVVAIVGTTWDEPAQAILPIIEEAKIPMIGQNQTRILEKEKDYNYFFSTWYDNEVGVKELLSFSKQKGWDRIAIVRPIAAGFYQYVSDLFTDNAEEFEIEVVENINLNNPTTVDFRTPLIKIKQEKIDAVLIVLNGFTECPFLRQVEELRLGIPVLSTEAAGDYTAIRNCPKLMENLYFSYPKESSNYSEFKKNYSNKFGVEPETPSVMTSYDAFNIIIESLSDDPTIFGEELAKKIGETEKSNGVSMEEISFDEIGFVVTPKDAFEIRTVKEGKFINEKDL